MDAWVNFLHIAAFYYCITNVASTLGKKGINVCSYTNVTYKKKHVSSLGVTYYKAPVAHCCNTWCWYNCYTVVTRSKAEVMYHIRTVAVQETKFRCCKGWSKEKQSSDECRKPICTKNCLNGGKCIKPNTCQCAAGFTGKRCESAALLSPDVKDSNVPGKPFLEKS